MASANASVWDLPSLPSYVLSPRPPLVPFISDSVLTLLLPIFAYWIFSMIFHIIDTYDLFPQYRLHTPAEVLKRNHATRWEVVRDVVIQQLVQTVVGFALSFLEDEDVVGKDDYNTALWAQRIRLAQRLVPRALALAGIDAQALALKASSSYPAIAAILSGGQYPFMAIPKNGLSIPAFAAWELTAASVIYNFCVPAMQFMLAIVIVDTWQYFLHRWMHMNKWLYTTFHSRHHRLYVPYAYGALYNHPFEGFLLDTLGTGIAYLVAGLTPRQAMWFFTGSTIKTVDDHCGDALPWDPLQHLTSNNAGYHDVHHQSWGVKTNFSQPFFTFWDRILGTAWTGGDVSARYERARLAAERKVREDDKLESKHKIRSGSITGSNPIDSILDDVTPYEADVAQASAASSTANSRTIPNIPVGKASIQALASREQVRSDAFGGGASVIAEEIAEEIEAKTYVRRSSPRKRSSTQTGTGSLKGLRDRVTTSGSFHGRTGGVLGYESTR